MRFLTASLQIFSVAGLLVGGMAFAADFSDSSAVGQYSVSMAKVTKSNWYCVSETQPGMQSSGHIGYGHGKTREESARRAIEACGRDGGFNCGEPECFPE